MEQAQFSSDPSPDFGPLRRSIYQKMVAKFNPTHLEIIDDTPAHAGHAAMKDHPTSTETHLKLIIVSDYFDKMMPIDRHREVQNELIDEFAAGLHALNIEAKTKKQWEAKLSKS